MKKIKVVIADDSVVYRSQIRAALGKITSIEVVSAVSNGRIAIDMLKQTEPDLLILDLEMPEMDGVQTLTEMSKLGMTTKVLVFSSASKRGAEITFEALRLGAKDFVTKPDGASGGPNPADLIFSLLEPKLKAFFPVEMGIAVVETKSTQVLETPSYPQVIWELFRPKVIVIGASTGGPTALEQTFSELHGELNVPILIAQHMPAVFTASLAERLGRMSGLRVKEAEQGETIAARTVYIAPGNFHMTITGTGDRPLIQLDQGPLINFVRPAVDPLFESAARIFKHRTLGIVFTGMGSDGRAGAQAIKLSGGGIAIQNKESCAVFGMPGAVFEAGAFDKILNPQELIQLIKDKAFSALGEVERKHA